MYMPLTPIMNMYVSILLQSHVSEIGAVVKVTDSSLCGWGSIPDKICSFFIAYKQGLITVCFICSDQHVKY